MEEGILEVILCNTTIKPAQKDKKKCTTGTKGKTLFNAFNVRTGMKLEQQGKSFLGRKKSGVLEDQG